MPRRIYDALTTLAAPIGAIYLRLSPKHRPLLDRLAPPEIAPELRGALWLQACSVGEVRTVLPLSRALQERIPGKPVVLTTSTVSGRSLAREIAGDVPHAWFPFDVGRSIRTFMDTLQPAALILLETEIWPNVIHEAARRGVPVILANGRLSDRHMPKYNRFRGLFGPAFQSLTLACMQNSEYASRVISLGAPANRVIVTGNIKFDGAAFEPDRAALERIRAEHRIRTGDRVIVCGSTRPGDEAMLARVFTRLHTTYADLRMVVVPRHPKRAAEVASRFGDRVTFRSAALSNPESAAVSPVLIVDTLGELAHFYACATVAVIGGSFFPGVNGHNPLEPAAFGVPTVFGPYMRNFIDPAEVLVKEQAAVQVKDEQGLYDAVKALLDHPVERAAIGQRAQTAIRGQQGALARTVDAIAGLIRSPH